MKLPTCCSQVISSLKIIPQKRVICKFCSNLVYALLIFKHWCKYFSILCLFIFHCFPRHYCIWCCLISPFLSNSIFTMTVLFFSTSHFLFSTNIFNIHSLFFPFYGYFNSSLFWSLFCFFKWQDFSAFLRLSRSVAAIVLRVPESCHVCSVVFGSTSECPLVYQATVTAV